ncbi:hypothetical protein B296_00028595 [Ensete ventricosum]|uniref:Aquaporin n=1 Tax=Ensete ventricosum TaxID=4639 RepID=A0A426Z094_ENSVE|nr:hypothetical protein B296_00028595 [Ensete ventricosum]
MGALQGVIMEIVLTFSLLFSVYATIVDPKKGIIAGLGPLLVGLVVGANILAGGPFSGASMNPARSFGPALAAWNWTDHWIYWVGPLAGGGLAGLVYEHLFMAFNSVLLIDPGCHPANSSWPLSHGGIARVSLAPPKRTRLLTSEGGGKRSGGERCLFDRERGTMSSTPIKYARRTSSGRIVSLSPDDDMDLGVSGEFTSTSSGGHNDYINYTVMMPPTPDNQPKAAAPGSKPGDHPSSFGGAAKGSGRRRRGVGEEGDGGGNGAGRMSVMKSMLMRSQTGDFDHNRWLFETKGTYGIGNAFWSKDEVEFDEVGEPMNISDFLEKPWKPLTRKMKVSPGILSPYR